MALVTLPNLGPDPFTVNASVLNGKVDPLATDYNGNIQNVNIASGAGIVYSKLSLTGGILNADINSSAAIVDTKLAQITTASKVSASSLASISFSVHKNATDQTGIVAATPTKLTWSTEEWDTHNYFASDKFTPLVAGKYLFVGSAIFSAGIDTVQFDVMFYKNGSLAKRASLIQASGTLAIQPGGSCILTANGSTDYFEMYVNFSSGADRTVEGAASLTYFQGYFIGA